MKILLAGNWDWPIYEESFSRALIDSGNEVIRFAFPEFFGSWAGSIQRTLPLIGPALIRMNKALLGASMNAKPDIVMIWRGTHILPMTIMRLNQSGISTISYNNDDPFGPGAHGLAPWHHHILWFWYLRCIRHHKYNYFYREINVEESKKYGAKHAAVLKPYFIPWRDRPIELSDPEKQLYKSQIVFIGHFESDGRLEYLRALVSAGFTVKVYGDKSWSKQALGDLYPYFDPIFPVRGDEYTKAICGAQICLAFLSKLNRDTYTRRCFEIPACGGILLAERTSDLVNMFTEEKEALYFSSCEELVSRATWLLGNTDAAKRIAEAGRRRVWRDGHDVNSRASKFIASLNVRESEPAGQ